MKDLGWILIGKNTFLLLRFKFKFYLFLYFKFLIFIKKHDFFMKTSF